MNPSLKPELPSARSNPSVNTAPDAAGPAKTDPSEERAWVERARGGDTEAFRKLVERHRDRAYGLAFRMRWRASTQTALRQMKSAHALTSSACVV